MTQRHSFVLVVTAAAGALACTAAGCGPIGNPDPQDRIEEGLPPASSFKCSSLDGTQTACVDFNDDSSQGFTSEGGEWQVIGGRYVGWGPDTAAGPCPDSLITHAVFTGVTAQDFSLHAQMASVERVDKVIVFRSQDPANRVQVNFRATDVDGGYGDLMVQEIKDCTFTKYTHDGEIPLPHAMDKPIDVDLDVQGTHLRIQVDGNTVFDQDEPITVRSGNVGFGVIDNSETVFDDLVVRARD